MSTHHKHRVDEKDATFRRRVLISLRVVAGFIVVACIALIILVASHPESPFKSVEVAFTDNSAHGMQIVPASCPSNPYDAEAPYGCSGSTPLCPNGVTPAPSGVINDCTCSEGNSSACMSCTVGISPNPSAYNYTGTPVALSWSASSNASEIYINNIGWVGPSGSTHVASTASTDYSCYAYNPTWGTSGWYGYSLTVNPPPTPTLAVRASQSSIQVGQSSTITATFAAGSGDSDQDTALNELPAGGSEYTIPGYGYSPVSSYSYTFTPSSAGTYTFKPYVITSYYGSWSTYGQYVNVTVTTPAPTATITVSPTSITRGSSATLSWSSTSATSCTISSVGTVGTSGSVQVAPSQTTTYSGSCTGPGGTTNFSGGGATLTVTTPAPTATITVSPTSITRGSSATLSWSSTSATSCTISSVGTVGTSGSVQVAPSQTTTYSGSCTGPGGTTNFSGGGATLTISCSVSYACSGSTIEETNANCSQTSLATCNQTDQYCQSNASQCQYYAISNNLSSGKYLQVVPNLVQSGETTQISWNVSDAQSCTVIGSNGDSWTGLASASGGNTSRPITSQTTYKLTCTGYGNNPSVTDTETINLTPQYHEQ